MRLTIFESTIKTQNPKSLFTKKSTRNAWDKNVLQRYNAVEELKLKVRREKVHIFEDYFNCRLF